MKAKVQGYQEIEGKTAEDIRKQLCGMLSIDGPHGLTATTKQGTEIHSDLFGSDYIYYRMDRDEQVNHLRNWALDIVTWCDDEEATASEMVAAELENTEIELPDWFDSHDKGLLTRFVKEALEKR